MTENEKNSASMKFNDTTVKKVEDNPVGKNGENKTKEDGSSFKKGCGCISAVLVPFLIFIFVLLAIFAFSSYEDWSLFSDDPSSTEEVAKGDLNVVVTSEEKELIDVIEENMQSVVSIAITQASFTPQEGVVDRSSNIGSGFIVDPNGLIATNQHVVSNTNATYKVITSTGDVFDVVEIVRDDVNDIAILRIEASGLNAVELGDSDALVQGQTAIAIGTPLGEYAGSVTKGVISGLNRSVTTGDGSFFGTVKTFEDVIQTDAAINPGNSGGPLLNSMGEVIGVNFATSAGADNISFALPINRVKDRLEEYRTYGKFIRPFVGIEYQMISQIDASYYENLVPGAFVRNVVQGSPAQTAGIKQGDIITKINGEAVENSFVNVIAEYTVGDEVEIEVYRDGEYLTLTVVLAEAE